MRRVWQAATWSVLRLAQLVSSTALTIAAYLRGAASILLRPFLLAARVAVEAVVAMIALAVMGVARMAILALARVRAGWLLACLAAAAVRRALLAATLLAWARLAALMLTARRFARAITRQIERILISILAPVARGLFLALSGLAAMLLLSCQPVASRIALWLAQLGRALVGTVAATRRWVEVKVRSVASTVSRLLAVARRSLLAVAYAATRPLIFSYGRLVTLGTMLAVFIFTAYRTATKAAGLALAALGRLASATWHALAEGVRRAASAAVLLLKRTVSATWQVLAPAVFGVRSLATGLFSFVGGAIVAVRQAIAAATAIVVRPICWALLTILLVLAAVRRQVEGVGRSVVAVAVLVYRASLGGLELFVRPLQLIVLLVAQAILDLGHALGSAIAAGLTAITRAIRLMAVAVVNVCRDLLSPMLYLGGLADRALSVAARYGGSLLAGYWQGIVSAGRVAWYIVHLPFVLLGEGFGAIGDGIRAGAWGWDNGRIPSFADFNLTRRRVASGTATASLLLGTLSAAVLAMVALAQPEPGVTVVHWSTGHLIRDGSDLHLLRQMAEEFNAQGLKTDSGKRIKVEVYYQGGAEQSAELISRLSNGMRIDPKLPDPTLVTPSASHWLVNVNYAAGRQVIDLSDTDSRSLARAHVGIVTYREMAECLGWPERELGYADIIELRNDPRGWGRYACAKAEWGERPLVAFTDPSTSDTGRAVLLTLYAIAADKAPDDLTAADLERPEVLDYVKHFQLLVDHYMVSTIPLNTKVHQGPRFGHFFLMPEDNLIHLYDGTETALVNGIEMRAPPIQHEMVLIYPKEGTLVRENCACAVRASWVDAEEAAANEAWFAFLRAPAQQAAFVRAGFRAGVSSEQPLGLRQARGLAHGVPSHLLHAERVDPAVAAAIDASWHVVKRPAIVTLVMDTSGSMLGKKLQRAKDGLSQAVEAMADNNQIGFVSFGDEVERHLAIAPVALNRPLLQEQIKSLKARGETALYDAIKAGIEMTDQAPGDSDAIRAVVVITDGRANRGSVQLSSLVRLASNRETPIRDFRGFADDRARDIDGRPVPMESMAGTGLVLPTRHPVQVFFVAIGADADLNVGRVLAGATGAEFQGVTEEDLAEVLEEFSRYF
jgi:Ca-activated chloride channel family protein